MRLNEDIFYCILYHNTEPFAAYFCAVVVTVVQIGHFVGPGSNDQLGLAQGLFNR